MNRHANTIKRFWNNHNDGNNNNDNSNKSKKKANVLSLSDTEDKDIGLSVADKDFAQGYTRCYKQKVERIRITSLSSGQHATCYPLILISF